MAKSKSQTKREKVQKEAVEGCEACNNTGLEPGHPTTESKLCEVCNGSPFEPREKVSDEVE